MSRSRWSKANSLPYQKSTSKQSKTLTYERPWFAPYQEESVFNDSKYAIIQAGTKVGKTSSCIGWLFEEAITGPGAGCNYWWIAPVYGQAEIAFDRLIAYAPEGFLKVNQARLRATLPNGARLWFKSADNPQTLYGDDVYAEVFDEAPRAKQDAWVPLRANLSSTNGRARIIGNIRGRKNWVFELAQKINRAYERNFSEPEDYGLDEWTTHIITSYDAANTIMPDGNPILDKHEIDAARNQMREEDWRELFLAEPSEDGGNPFGIAAIREVTIKRLVNSKPVAWGWDLAGTGGDYTVGIGLDKYGIPCRMYRWHKDWPETQRDILRIIGRVPATIDATTYGAPVVAAMKRKKPGTIEGYTFNSKTKQPLMEELAMAIQGKKTCVVEGQHKQEMESYEYVYDKGGTSVKYSAPTGYHDDIVCAHALAWWQLKNGKARYSELFDREDEEPDSRQISTLKRFEKAFKSIGGSAYR